MDFHCRGSLISSLSSDQSPLRGESSYWIVVSEPLVAPTDSLALSDPFLSHEISLDTLLDQSRPIAHVRLSPLLQSGRTNLEGDLGL